jgi:TP901-1 family phage major tail protein
MKIKAFNLQLFAEAVSGKKIIYLYRVQKNAAAEPGTVIAFVTENSLSISKDAEVTETKDGPMRTPNKAELEVQSTSIFKKGDAMIEKLKAAMLADDLLEIWRANLEEAGSDNKFKGTYYQGYLTSFEESSSAEDFVEYSLTFGINGIGANGDVTVTAQQQEAAAYTFADTPKTGTGTGA